jgi:hypothetical protein
MREEARWAFCAPSLYQLPGPSLASELFSRLCFEVPNPGASFFSLPYWSSWLLLNLTGPNWAVMGDAKRTQDRQADRKWDQVCWPLGWRCTAASLLFYLYYSLHLLCFFSLSLFFKTLLLYSSLKPCFTIL